MADSRQEGVQLHLVSLYRIPEKLIFSGLEKAVHLHQRNLFKYLS